jgi:MOSC domain-containing protein YiiM
MEEPQMAALLVAHGRPGFYLRVLEEGEVEAGDEILRVASGPERMQLRQPKTGRRSTTRTGAKVSPLCSAMAGNCRPMTGTRRCCSSSSTAIAS